MALSVGQLIEVLKQYPEHYAVNLDTSDGQVIASGVEETFNTDEWSMNKEIWDAYLAEHPLEAPEWGVFDPNGVTIYGE